MRDAVMDQASGLRRIFARPALYALAVAGAGGTAVTLNLADALVRQGQRVLVLDRARGEAAAALHLKARYDLMQALAGDVLLADALVTGPGGVSVLPAARGLDCLARDGDDWRGRLEVLLAPIAAPYDAWLVNGVPPAGSRADVLVVVSPTQNALTEAYARIKALSRERGHGDFRIVVDRARSESAALAAYRSVAEAAHRFLGARLDYQRVGGLPSNQQLNPKLGLRYQADGETSFRASVGRGFRAPSIAELFVSTSLMTSTVAVVPNPDLKPEHSWSYEVGGTRNFGENAAWDLAVFQSDFSNLIEAGIQIDTTRHGPVVRFGNVTQARIQGCESNIRTAFFDKLISFDVNYTYAWPVDVNNKSILRFRPRHVASINAVVSHREFTFGTDIRYVSRLDAIDDDLVRLAPIKDGDVRVPVYVVDVRARRHFHEFGFPLTINFQVNNLLRYSYVELMGNLAPLRSFVLSVEGAF